MTPFVIRKSSDVPFVVRLQDAALLAPLLDAAASSADRATDAAERVEGIASTGSRSVATFAEREAIPLAQRGRGLTVRVLEAAPDGGREFVWDTALAAPGAWTGLLTLEESQRLDLMHGGIGQDKVYGLEGTLDALREADIAATRVTVASARADVAQGGGAVVTWTRTGTRDAAQAVSWGGWTLPLRGDAQRFDWRDWAKVDRLFVAGNSLSDTVGSSDQWSQLLAADLGIPLVSVARGSSDARQVYKAGARAITLTLAGPLPAGGSVAIGQINGAAPGWDNAASFLNSYGGDSSAASMAGWASDGQVTRRATVAISRSDAFDYRLSQVGGDAAAFAGAVTFTPDAALEPARSTCAIWIGNNYFFSGVPNAYGDHTNPQMWVDLDALVRTAAGGRIFLLPILPAAAWTARGLGTPYDAHLAANARTRSLYPRLWLVDGQGRDLTAYLQAIGSDGSPEDQADVAQGFTPRSCRVDDLHLNGKGRSLVRDFVKIALALQALPPAITAGTAITITAAGGGGSDSALAIAHAMSAPALFVQTTPPVATGPYQWWDTSGGNLTLWIEDGR